MLGYKYTFDLKEGKSTSVMPEQMPSQREQYSCVNLCQMMDKVKTNIKVCF
jgi:hypothetical protein